ncbi:S8 family serine peptidase [Streptomyces sp. NPDC003011]
MARTRTRRLRAAGGPTAASRAVALSAIALPAHAVPEKRTPGAEAPGSAGGSGGRHLVTREEGIKARPAAGKDPAEKSEKYGAGLSHAYGDRVPRNAREPAVADLSQGGCRNARLDTAVRNSTTPRGTYTVAPGVSVVPVPHARDTGRAASSGTSMAAPHTAGAATLRLAVRPGATAAQFGNALVTRAASGKVSGRDPGSPDRLLQVPR